LDISAAHRQNENPEKQQPPGGFVSEEASRGEAHDVLARCCGLKSRLAAARPPPRSLSIFHTDRERAVLEKQHTKDKHHDF
jgi:hypothetical protein